MKYFNFNIILTALVGFSSSSLAAVIDQGNTSVFVKTSNTDLDAFNVTLVRDDKLFDDGDLIAARSLSMTFQFHIKDDKLHYQNELVPEHGEKPKVTVVKASFAREDVNPEVVDSLFSEGIVGVEITSEVENTLTPNPEDPENPLIFGRHITLHEKIIEVDGKKIRESDIYEHVIDLDRDGSVVRVISDPILAKQATISADDDSEANQSALSACEDIFDSIDIGSLLFQVFVYGFSIFLVVAIFKLLFLARQSYLRRNVAYQAVESSDLPPSYNAKDAAIFGTDAKEASTVTVTEEDEAVNTNL